MVKAYKAKWIIPSDGNVYEDCALVVDEGKVVEIVKQEKVNEETGKISVAKDGTLIADVKEEVLKKILIKTLVTDKFRTEKKEHKLKIFSKSKEKQVQNNKKTE